MVVTSALVTLEVVDFGGSEVVVGGSDVVVGSSCFCLIQAP